MNTQKFYKWIEIKDGELVKFGDLAHLIATALHPSDNEAFAYEVAMSMLKKELPKAVDSGELVVRNALTRGVHDFPLGDGLQRAVILQHDLRPFLASYEIGLHIMPPVSPAAALPDRLTNASAQPPGKAPNNSVGKLAVKAAWEIECKENRRATDREVIDRLQQWADNGDEPAILKKSDRGNRSVVWMTTVYKEKNYTLEACQKTLAAWSKSRE